VVLDKISYPEGILKELGHLSTENDYKLIGKHGIMKLLNHDWLFSDL
jgi:hypothetical protein